MEIYWEDIAFEVKTKKYKTIRLVVCGVLIFFIFISSLIIFGTYLLQDEEIKENNRLIAEYEAKLLSLQQDILDYQESDGYTQYYNSAEIGDQIAVAQSRYGGFASYTDIATITQSAQETADLLDNYIYSGQGRTPWYQNSQCDYTWSYLMRQTAVIDSFPCIWVCKAEDAVLAVTTGIYEGKTQRFGDFKTYYTTQGNALMNETNVLTDEGVVVSDYDYESQYQNVEDIQETVSEQAKEQTQESTQETTEESTEESTQEVVSNTSDNARQDNNLSSMMKKGDTQ